MKKLLAVLGVSCVILTGLLLHMLIEYNKPITQDTEKLAVVEVTPIASPAIPTRSVVEAPAVTRTDANPPSDNKGEPIVESSEKQWSVSLEQDIKKQEEQSEEEIETHDAFSYAYGMLNENERQLYDALYRITVCYKQEALVPTVNPEELDRVFNCVMMDHPEIFYVNGYKYTKYTVGDEIKRILFSPSFVYTSEETDAINDDLHDAIQAIVGNVYAGWSDYEKIKYIYDVLAYNTEYDLDAEDNQNIISVLLNGRSVCQGYAKTMQTLLNILEIPCTLATGYVSGGERHAWNVVKADGEWYYVDVTWGDAAYILSGDAGNGEVASTINYDYLLVPYRDISMTHALEVPVNMPDCTSLNDNYYVKEGLYFNSYNTDRLKAAFDRAYANGDQTVTVKCSDEVVYKHMYNQLIDEQHIFDFIRDNKDIAYSYNPSAYKLVFAIKR